MRYIRTKDGIYENKPLEVKYTKNGRGGYSVEIKETDIINQADTIPELCDEFVCSNEHWINHKYMCPEIEDAINYKDSCEKFSKTPTDLFGAIWTDKGLIYVAKMNEKGELELL